MYMGWEERMTLVNQQNVQVVNKHFKEIHPSFLDIFQLSVYHLSVSYLSILLIHNLI